MTNNIDDVASCWKAGETNYKNILFQKPPEAPNIVNLELEEETARKENKCLSND